MSLKRPRDFPIHDSAFESLINPLYANPAMGGNTYFSSSLLLILLQGYYYSFLSITFCTTLQPKITQLNNSHQHQGRFISSMQFVALGYKNW